jgi:hypothetical protein
MALKPLGGCKVAVSALSSKLLSVGALLATYEMYRIDDGSVGFAHIDGQEYEVDEEYLRAYPTNMSESIELCALWIFGDAYEETST